MNNDAFPERPVLTIVGPTGAGKSALALHIAKNFKGEIVNCDSLQLYRGFDIGTAKTPVAERTAVPYHLFDVLDPQQGYSAGEYARHAREVIREISTRGGLPIIAGGTGFYLTALQSGLPELPQRDTSIRDNLTIREAKRPGALHRLLRRLDPLTAARIHPNDLHKIVRALEVRVLTRKPRPQSSDAEPLRGFRIFKVGLDPDRAHLHALLDERTKQMFRSGLLREVEELLSKGCTGFEKPFEALGYRQALKHIRGDLSLEQAIASTQLQTRQYAKRQMTWFRRDTQVQWLSGFGHSPSILEQCFELVQRFC